MIIAAAIAIGFAFLVTVLNDRLTAILNVLREIAERGGP